MLQRSLDYEEAESFLLIKKMAVPVRLNQLFEFASSRRRGEGSKLNVEHEGTVRKQDSEWSRGRGSRSKRAQLSKRKNCKMSLLQETRKLSNTGMATTSINDQIKGSKTKQARKENRKQKRGPMSGRKKRLLQNILQHLSTTARCAQYLTTSIRCILLKEDSNGSRLIAFTLDQTFNRDVSLDIRR